MEFNNKPAIVTGAGTLALVRKGADAVLTVAKDERYRGGCGLVLEKYRQAVEEKTVVSWEETSDYVCGRLTGKVNVAPVSALAQQWESIGWRSLKPATDLFAAGKARERHAGRIEHTKAGTRR